MLIHNRLHFRRRPCSHSFSAVKISHISPDTHRPSLRNRRPAETGSTAPASNMDEARQPLLGNNSGAPTPTGDRNLTARRWRKRFFVCFGFIGFLLVVTAIGSWLAKNEHEGFEVSWLKIGGAVKGRRARSVVEASQRRI